MQKWDLEGGGPFENRGHPNQRLPSSGGGSDRFGGGKAPGAGAAASRDPYAIADPRTAPFMDALHFVPGAMQIVNPKFKTYGLSTVSEMPQCGPLSTNGCGGGAGVSGSAGSASGLNSAANGPSYAATTHDGGNAAFGGMSINTLKAEMTSAAAHSGHHGGQGSAGPSTPKLLPGGGGGASPESGSGGALSRRAREEAEANTELARKMRWIYQERCKNYYQKEPTALLGYLQAKQVTRGKNRVLARKGLAGPGAASGSSGAKRKLVVQRGPRLAQQLKYDVFPRLPLFDRGVDKDRIVDLPARVSPLQADRLSVLGGALSQVTVHAQVASPQIVDPVLPADAGTWAQESFGHDDDMDFQTEGVELGDFQWMDWRLWEDRDSFVGAGDATDTEESDDDDLFQRELAAASTESDYFLKFGGSGPMGQTPAIDLSGVHGTGSSWLSAAGNTVAAPFKLVGWIGYGLGSGVYTAGKWTGRGIGRAGYAVGSGVASGFQAMVRLFVGRDVDDQQQTGVPIAVPSAGPGTPPDAGRGPPWGRLTASQRLHRLERQIQIDEQRENQAVHNAILQASKIGNAIQTSTFEQSLKKRHSQSNSYNQSPHDYRDGMVGYSYSGSSENNRGNGASFNDLLLVNQTGLLRLEDVQVAMKWPPIMVDSPTSARHPSARSSSSSSSSSSGSAASGTDSFYNFVDDQAILDRCCPTRVFKPYGFGNPAKPSDVRLAGETDLYEPTSVVGDYPIFYACASDRDEEQHLQSWIYNKVVPLPRSIGLENFHFRKSSMHRDAAGGVRRKYSAKIDVQRRRMLSGLASARRNLKKGRALNRDLQHLQESLLKDSEFGLDEESREMLSSTAGIESSTAFSIEMDANLGGDVSGGGDSRSYVDAADYYDSWADSSGWDMFDDGPEGELDGPEVDDDDSLRRLFGSGVFSSSRRGRRSPAARHRHDLPKTPEQHASDLLARIRERKSVRRHGKAFHKQAGAQCIRNGVTDKRHGGSFGGYYCSDEAGGTMMNNAADTGMSDFSDSSEFAQIYRELEHELADEEAEFNDRFFHQGRGASSSSSRRPDANDPDLDEVDRLDLIDSTFPGHLSGFSEDDAESDADVDERHQDLQDMEDELHEEDVRLGLVDHSKVRQRERDFPSTDQAFMGGAAAGAGAAVRVSINRGRRASSVSSQISMPSNVGGAAQPQPSAHHENGQHGFSHNRLEFPRDGLGFEAWDLEEISELFSLPKDGRYQRDLLDDSSDWHDDEYRDEVYELQMGLGVSPLTEEEEFEIHSGPREEHGGQLLTKLEAKFETAAENAYRERQEELL